MISRYKPCCNREELKALFYPNKEVATRFEKDFARYIGNKYAISFPFARSAFYAILKCLKMNNDEILTPSYTSMSVPYIIVESSNIPRFVDISLYDYNSKAKDVVDAITSKTKAIIPTHMYGYPVDIKAIKEETPEDILIIEDAALALKNSDVGKFSDLTFFSLGIKQLTTFNGGVVTTNNFEIYEKLKEFADSNLKKNKTRNLKKLFTLFFSYFAYQEPFNRIFCIWQEKQRYLYYVKYLTQTEDYLPKEFLARYTETQAKIGIAQLKKYKKFTKNRKKIVEFYNERLSNIDKISIPPITNDGTFSHYTIRVEQRDLFMQRMFKKGIQTDFIFPYSTGNLKIFEKFATGEYKNSLIASKHVVNLPCYPNLYNESGKLEYIAKCVKECSI